MVASGHILVVFSACRRRINLRIFIQDTQDVVVESTDAHNQGDFADISDITLI
jgi:hypothetical protein